MKRIERHKLKENEFARTLSHAREVVEQRRRDVATAVVVVLVLLAVVGGYAWWRYARDAKANGSLAAALATYAAPVVPPTPPAPGSPPPVPQPGTYGSERAKLEAALPKFLETANTYPNTSAGITARYYVGSILASLGRHAEAEQRYSEVVDKAGNSIYGRTAKLGLAETQIAQGKLDSAIDVLTELSRDTNSHIPVDGVLMQLGRAYARAGKKEEATRAFTRIIDEFPQSLYAADAKREMEEVKKS
jgi:tetratricopeptide (TPR) repeat protein